jgi:hypothetical protein
MGWDKLKPRAENQLQEIFSHCGPQCFADANHRIPICPKCDHMQCYCHPECGALLYAYKKGYDQDTMLRYAKMMGCGWVPSYDTGLPIASMAVGAAPTPSKKKGSRKGKSHRERVLKRLVSKVPDLLGFQIIASDMAALFTKTGIGGAGWVLETMEASGKSNIADNLTDAQVQKFVQDVPYKAVQKVQITTKDGKTVILYESL